MIQETYLKICDRRILHHYRPDHPNAIYGLLQSVSFSVARDYCRSVQTQKRGGDVRIVPIESGENPRDSRADESMDRRLLLREVADNLEEISPVSRDRHIFWLYYRHGLTCDAIARLAGIGLTAKGVESVIHRLTREVRRRMVSAAIREADQEKGIAE